MAFRRAGYENPIHAVCRGEDVLEYLKGQGEYAERAKFPLPHLVLLDLNTLGMSGWEGSKLGAQAAGIRLIAGDRLHWLGTTGRQTEGRGPWRECLRDQAARVRGIY